MDPKPITIAATAAAPAHYQVPIFRSLSKDPAVDLIVFYYTDIGANASFFDHQFNTVIEADIDVLSGYPHRFLKNISLKPSWKFFGQINPGIVPLILRKKYDAVIVHGWYSFSNWLVFLTAFLSGTPVFMRGENPLNQEIGKRGLKQLIKRQVLGWLFRRIGAFLYIGEENRKFYLSYGVPEERLFFTPYAVDNDYFLEGLKHREAFRGKIRRELGLDDSQPLILFVGKLIAKKHPKDLLLAYQKALELPAVRERNPVLLFVGDGSLREELQDYATRHGLHNARFAGFKTQPELREYYSAADIFVLPSGPGETWGLVVNEAMCFDLPVIVSDVVGSGPDLVKAGENGYIVGLGDAAALADRLGILANDEGRRRAFGKRSGEIIKGYTHAADVAGIKAAIAYSKNKRTNISAP